MNREPKYINYYNLALKQGCAQGMSFQENYQLSLDTFQSGYYIAKMFDTGDNDTTLNRLAIEAGYEGAHMTVWVAATQEREQYINNCPVNLEEYLVSKDINPADKALMLEELPHIRAIDCDDMLLYSLKGRYIWIMIGIMPEKSCDCHLKGFRLDYPQYTFLRYFPEIYQENDFFERYVAIFQSLYLDQQKRVTELPRLLDYESTPDSQIEYLAQWLGIKNEDQLYSTGQLRKMIADINLYQGAKGTRKALEAIVKLLLGISPRIVEHFQWDRPELAKDLKNIFELLYGEESNSFCLILDLTSLNYALPVKRKQLEQLIEQYCMLGTKFKLVCLENCCYADTYCYLDVNSTLAVPTAASVDNSSLGSYVTIG